MLSFNMHLAISHFPSWSRLAVRMKERNGIQLDPFERMPIAQSVSGLEYFELLMLA